jgi:hypothetical protein
MPHTSAAMSACSISAPKNHRNFANCAMSEASNIPTPLTEVNIKDLLALFGGW